MMSTRISIVDDDPSVRRSLDWLCKSVGYLVDSYESAEDFLAAPNLHDTDCLVLDVDLPGKSGLQLHRELRAAAEHVPVIFITAFDDQLVRQQAFETGAVEFLNKPLDREKLLDAIGRALEDQDLPPEDETR